MQEDFLHRVFGTDLSQADTPRILAEDGVAAGLPADISVQNTSGLRMPVPVAQVLEWIVKASEFSPEVLGGMYCFRVVSDGETRFVFAGQGWGMALLVIYMKGKTPKTAPLPEDPAERLKIFCEQIRTSGPGYDLTAVLDCLAELKANAEATIPIIFTVPEFLHLCEQWPFEHDPATPSVVRFSDTYGNPTYIIIISESLSPVVEAIAARKKCLAMSGYPEK